MPDVYRIYKVVSDVRSAPGAAFALEAERLGATVVRIGGDITDFWYTDLSRRWREAPLAIAGLTAYGPIFCLERWAWDHGLRVVLRGEHRAFPGGVEHAIAGPAATTAGWADASAGADGHWSPRVARLVTACAAGRCLPEPVTTTERTAEGVDELPEPLVSWVIAPAGRA